MEKLKKIVRPMLMWTISIILYIVVLSVLNYTGLISLASVVKINFIAVAVITLIFGILCGKKTSKKGYLEGIKMGSMIVLIIFLLNLIFYRTFSLYILLYYLVIIVSSTIGSMIGINLKR